MKKNSLDTEIWRMRASAGDGQALRRPNGRAIDKFWREAPRRGRTYAYGKSRRETMLDASGVRRKRVRKLPRSEWQVLIRDHHPGFIDWRTYEANQDRIAQNTRPGPHKAGGAVREGSALLQGLAACGRCGRRLHTHYRGRSSAPGYHCPGKILVEGRGVYCLNIGAIQIDEAVTRAFIAALEPAKLAATVAAAERLEADRETSLRQWRLGVERASYEASRAERRYRAVDPDKRLVARGLEREWEERQSALEAAKAELSRREEARPRALSQDERGRLLALGADLGPPSGTQRPALLDQSDPLLFRAHRQKDLHVSC